MSRIITVPDFGTYCALCICTMIFHVRILLNFAYCLLPIAHCLQAKTHDSAEPETSWARSRAHSSHEGNGLHTSPFALDPTTQPGKLPQMHIPDPTGPTATAGSGRGPFCGFHKTIGNRQEAIWNRQHPELVYYHLALSNTNRIC